MGTRCRRGGKPGAQREASGGSLPGGRRVPLDPYGNGRGENPTRPRRDGGSAGVRSNLGRSFYGGKKRQIVRSLASPLRSSDRRSSSARALTDAGGSSRGVPLTFRDLCVCTY